jgi:hypothetical protein
MNYVHDSTDTREVRRPRMTTRIANLRQPWFIVPTTLDDELCQGVRRGMTTELRTVRTRLVFS